jgi:nucleoside 2-deoxyribosyltransferase
MSEKIFLSYARQDRRLVGAVQRALLKNGIVERDDTVIVGPHQQLRRGMTNFRKTIKEQIGSASTVVIIVSNHSANSVWVNYEAGMAAALGKPIVLIGKKVSGKATTAFKALGNVQSIEIEDKGVNLPGKKRGTLRTAESLNR